MWDFTLVNFYCQILFKKKNKKYKKNLRFFLWEGGPKGHKLNLWLKHYMLCQSLFS